MAVATHTSISPDVTLNLQKGNIRLEEAREDMLIAGVPSRDLTESVGHIKDVLGDRFITSVGTDMRAQNGCYRVSQLFGLDAR